MLEIPLQLCAGYAAEVGVLLFVEQVDVLFTARTTTVATTAAAAAPIPMPAAAPALMPAPAAPAAPVTLVEFSAAVMFTGVVGAGCVGAVF